MGTDNRWNQGRLVWALSLSGAVACGSSVIVEGGAGAGGDGGAGGGSTTTTGSSVSSSATGTPVDCGSLSDESGCLQANGCAPLYDWTPAIPGAPAPPPGPPIVASPCCPECLAPDCIACHQAAFTYCVPVASKCNPVLPLDVCGFSADCP